MAKPFSIAGSAVGNLSLGISLCQGLISYTNEAKDANEKTLQISTQLDRLTDMLDRLQAVFNTLKSSTCAFSVNSVITAFATAIESICKNLKS
jgi:hypothetical protein